MGYSSTSRWLSSAFPKKGTYGMLSDRFYSYRNIKFLGQRSHWAVGMKITLLFSALCYLHMLSGGFLSCLYPASSAATFWHLNPTTTFVVLAEGARRQNCCSCCHFLFPFREARILKGICYTSPLEQIDHFQCFLEHSACLGRWLV